MWPLMDISPWMDGPASWPDAAISTFTDQTGVAIFALIIGTGLMIALYAYSRNIVLPSIVGILIAGTVLNTVPPAAQQVVVLLMLLVLALALYSAWRRPL